MSLISLSNCDILLFLLFLSLRSQYHTNFYVWPLKPIFFLFQFYFYLKTPVELNLLMCDTKFK